MKNTLFIRKENIDLTEKRAPFSPEQVGKLISENNINVIVEHWANRTFSASQYQAQGAVVANNPDSANIIFGVKEIPVEDLSQNQRCAFFSHTIKGQTYNMPLLQAILDKRITLLDYEKVTDSSGKRLIFFGPYAGLAGAINTIWLLGARLNLEGINNPFSKIKQAKDYISLKDAQHALKSVAAEIKKDGLPDIGKPWVFAITGNGTVSKGAQQILDILPVKHITPQEFLQIQKEQSFDLNILYKVVIDCDNFVTPVDSNNHFEWDDYFQNPKKYKADFNKYLPNITTLINCIYWEKSYPKLVTKASLKHLFEDKKQPNLRIISDITCDIEGSVECNLQTTTSDNPAYVYNPLQQNIKNGIGGNGLVIMAVDKLPSELPKESTEFFGNSLLPFIPALAQADYSLPFDKLDIPEEFKRATIAHHGKLTPAFEYLYKFLK